METEKMTTRISGRPSNRPYVACGSYANQQDASAAAQTLSIGAQTWRAVHVERSTKRRTHAIRRTA